MKNIFSLKILGCTAAVLIVINLTGTPLMKCKITCFYTIFLPILRDFGDFT